MKYFVGVLLFCVASAASQAVNPEDVRFFLTTSTILNREIKTGELAGLNIDPTHDVKILCHGWLEIAGSDEWYSSARTEYLRKGSTTVITVDWSKHSNLAYILARDSLPDVAFYSTLMLLDLAETYNIPFSRVHVIGHSLGAHLAGFIGKNVISMRPGSIVGRVTGLDPAGSSFDFVDASGRIDESDATFVDVMYTDSVVTSMARIVGHVSYYPNGGIAVQNGCLTAFCSHNRAPVYFVESINSNGFVSTRCTTYLNFTLGLCFLNERIVMGENVNQSARGTFFLTTRFFAPFAQG